MGAEHGSATVENSLVVPEKINHRIIVLPYNFTPRNILKITEYILKQVHGHPCYSSTSYDSQRVQRAQMSMTSK